MQRNLLSKFRPLLRKVNGCASIAPVLVASRSFQATSTTSGKITPKMANLQKKYQEDNDKPVFLKGGAFDNILYRLTLVLCLVGLVGDIMLWFGYILE